MIKNFLTVQKKSTADAIKTASKKAIQKKKKNSETTGDLIGNKIADKITIVSKKSSAKLPSQTNEANDESEHQRRKIHISRKKATNY